MATIDNECQICYEKFTAHARKPIECHACFQIACSSCVVYYLLNTTGNPTCMFKNCNKSWSDNYIFETLGKSVYSKFRDFKLEQLFQKEKSLMPKTQIKIQNRREAELLTEEIRKVEGRMFVFQQMFRFADTLKHYNKYCGDHPIVNVHNELVLKKEQNEISKHHTLLTQKRNKLLNGNEKEKLKFIKNCGKANCLGLLSTKWICGTCKTKFCKHCGEEKGIATDMEIIADDDEEGVAETKDEGESKVVETKSETKSETKAETKVDTSGHTCDPNLVETMKAIQKETKACPKCGISIYKIEGCSQMWCTNCHTAFDWNTRRIETGRIHNPHYYDWQRKNNNGTAPRVPGDIPLCQQVPHFFNNPLKFRFLDGDTILCLEDFYRFVNEVDEIYNPANFHDIDENTFEYYREQLINNSYPSEKHYKTNLKKAFNKFEKGLETQQIFLTFKTIIVETLNNLNFATKEQIMSELIDTIHNVVDFTNENLVKLSLKYSTSVYDKIEYKRRQGNFRWFINSINKNKE